MLAWGNAGSNQSVTHSGVGTKERIQDKKTFKKKMHTTTHINAIKVNNHNKQINKSQHWTF